MNRFNSTIKQKTCKCGCGLMPTLGWSGFKMSHAPQELKDKQTKKQVEKKNRAKLSDLSRKLHLAANDKGNEIKLNGELPTTLQAQLPMWFIDRMEKCEPKCENCQKTANFLKNPEYIRLWKSCQAHLLPKRHFKSLQTYPLNGMVLGSGLSGMCNCHDNYDASWDKAAKMPIWDEVVRRFLIMYPLIQPDEHQYIPDVLLQEINQI